MRKCILFLYIIIGISKIINAQPPLVVDAGKDTSYCFHVSQFNYIPNTLVLGGVSTAIGGKKPYTYNWIMYSKTTGKIDSLLIDSGIQHNANPKVILPIIENIGFGVVSYNGIYIFKVIVTDSSNTQMTDSCEIKISRQEANIDLSGQSCHEIYSSDSVQLYPCGTNGGIPPFTSYNWTPIDGLSNPHISNPKAVLIKGLNFIYIPVHILMMLVVQSIVCMH